MTVYGPAIALPSTVTFSRVHVVGTRRYWRTATVVMACHAYNAAAPKSDSHWFDASWQPRWYGAKVLTIREHFAS